MISLLINLHELGKIKKENCMSGIRKLPDKQQIIKQAKTKFPAEFKLLKDMEKVLPKKYFKFLTISSRGKLILDFRNFTENYNFIFDTELDVYIVTICMTSGIKKQLKFKHGDEILKFIYFKCLIYSKGISDFNIDKELIINTANTIIDLKDEWLIDTGGIITYNDYLLNVVNNISIRKINKVSYRELLRIISKKFIDIKFDLYINY